MHHVTLAKHFNQKIRLVVAKANFKKMMTNNVEQKQAEHDAITSGNQGCNNHRTFTARSSAFVACGIVILVVMVVVLTVTTTTVMARTETSLQPGMMTPQASGDYQGNCILIDRETRLVDYYKEEAASFKNESDSGCIVSFAGQGVLHLVGRECDAAAIAQCVAYPYADWCAHEEYKPFCLPQNDCTNPFEFDASLLYDRVSFEKCENGVLTFRFNGTYSNDAPLIKNVGNGKLVIDASGTVVATYFDKNQDRQTSDDPNVVYGKDITLVTFSNVQCDDTKATKYVCENLTEWQDELGTWLPWEYPCWIFSELSAGQNATVAQVKDLCECMMFGS